jgi:DNA-binding transcriptional MocR family regulator
MAWQPRIKLGAGSKFMGLVTAIEEDILAGLIGEGERMPPQRAVAEALGIDLTTVTRAYNEAKTRGLLASSPGRGGTRVADSAEGPARRAVAPTVDLSLNIPPQPARADLAGRIGRTVAEVLRGGTQVLHYVPAVGTESDRLAGAAWLRPVAGPRLDERIVIAGGAQAALFAVCGAILRPGDRICAGEVAYPGIRAVAAHVGADLVGLRVDGEGISPEAFAEACAARAPRAIYLVPAIDNPTTATMSEARRAELAAIAHRHGVVIIEDDPYRWLLDAPPPAFAMTAPSLTYHIATLAKCATPGLRVAYVLAPDARAAEAVGEVLRATTLMASPLMAGVATRWIADGTLPRIVEAIREESAMRQTMAARLLKDFAFHAHPRGHHIWLPLPQSWDAEDFSARAAQLGVAVVSGRHFSVSGANRQAIRISLGSAPDRMALTGGLRRLAELLAAQHRPRATVV